MNAGTRSPLLPTFAALRAVQSAAGLLHLRSLRDPSLARAADAAVEMSARVDALSVDLWHTCDASCATPCPRVVS